MMWKSWIVAFSPYGLIRIRRIPKTSGPLILGNIYNMFLDFLLSLVDLLATRGHGVGILNLASYV